MLDRHPFFFIALCFQAMLKIRLQKFGSIHAPTYRLVVAEAQARRNGKFVEILGHYNPKARGEAPRHVLRLDRVDHWLGIGAQPSDTAKGLIRKCRQGSSLSKSA